MKRSTLNPTNRKVKPFLSLQRQSINDKPQGSIDEHFVCRHPFANSGNAVLEIVEQVIEKVNLVVKKIEETKYFQLIEEKTNEIYRGLEGHSQPIIDDSRYSDCPEAEPLRSNNDQICARECTLERKQHKKAVSSLSSLQSLEQFSQKASEKNIFILKPARNSNKMDFVPLQGSHSKSQKDLKLLQFQANYRQKYKEEVQSAIDDEQKPPNLLVAKKINKKEKQQYSFDYDGEKIPISSVIIHKNNKVNVLKTLYKIHKDNKDQVKAPKRMLERVSFSRLPSLHSKKSLLNNTIEIHDLKKDIQKLFSQKGCRLSSIKQTDQQL